MARGNSPYLRPLGVFNSVFISDGEDVGDRSDYRQVPASDEGNSSYSDVGGRGSYAPRTDSFPDPNGLMRFAGYGADEADLRQGFVRPTINQDPAYDLINYKNRSSQPIVNGEDFENTAQVPADYEFRGRNIRSRGLFSRPHLPTER